MGKWAPPREDGLKPWVVVRNDWAHESTRIVYAESARDAEYATVGRQRYVYAKARRATPDDLAKLAGGVSDG